MSDLINKKDLLEIIAQTKRVFGSENQDYYTGYMCALAGLEGVIAGQPTVEAIPKKKMQEIVERLEEASFPHKIGGETQMIVLKERIDEIVKEVGGMSD